MKKILVFLLLFVGALNAQQIPWTIQEGPIAVNNGTANWTAPYEFHMPFQSPGPVLFTQNIHADVTAGQRIVLGPGFRAGDFSNSNNYNPYFHAQIGAAPDFEVVYLQPNSNYPQVGQFEKLEMGIRLPSVLEQQVNTFIASGQVNGALNPFDPEQISLEAVFSNGAHSYTVYGFYYDEFERDPAALAVYVPANWIAQPTNYHWRVRFAPPYTGYWNCSVSIRVGSAATYSYAVNNMTFNCVPSNNPGFLKKGNDNRHLAFSGTGESFFALGQNIAWNDQYNGEVFFRGDYMTNNPRGFNGGFLDVLDWIENLSDNGGNMVRICTIGWSFELEPYQLNNYSDRMNHEWELDRLFELCEQKHVMISFSFADRRFKNSRGETNSLMNWENNPYHTQLPGIDTPDDFLTDANAINIFSKKIHYFFARYGYSTSLGIFAPMGEIDGGYDDHAANENNLYNWFATMFGLAKNLTLYRPLLTSTSYGNHKEIPSLSVYSLGDCDITSVHSYHNERDNKFVSWNEFNKSSGIDQGTLSVWDNKPTYFEEMGMASTDADQGDIEGCSDITYHNSLWSGAFMGGFGTGFVWWQWFNNDYRADNFPALNTFFSDIDFQSIQFNRADYWDDAPNSDDRHAQSKIETFYLRDQRHADRAIGWVHNATYWWGNIDENCEDRNGHVMTIDPASDDTYTDPQLIYPIEFEISNLNNSATYYIDFYDTRNNGGVIQTKNLQSNIFGKIFPLYPGHDPDYAYKLYRVGNNFRQSNEITYDTLQCDEDTIFANGNHFLDSLNTFEYHWDFGNGQISNERNSTAIYSEPGIYLVSLIVSDSLGWSDTLREYVVKPVCDNLRFQVTDKAKCDSILWKIYPNPSSSSISINLGSEWSNQVTIEIFGLDGRSYVTNVVHLKEVIQISVGELATGNYLLQVSDEHLTACQLISIIR